MTEQASPISRDDALQADVLVVGAGAAGLATAIFAARRNPTLNIVALDTARKLGAKILVSGGGRCNVTNVEVTEADFWGGSRNVVRRVLRSFPAGRTVGFFKELGVSLHKEEHGKLFPDSNQARTVLDALIAEAGRRGVQLLTGQRVVQIKRRAAGFEITANSAAEESRIVLASRVILATGGRSLPKTGSDGTGYQLARSLGHSLSPTTPALVPLILEGDFHAELSGISQEVELTFTSVPNPQSAIRNRQSSGSRIRLRGSMLWTHFGISGPVVLDVSRFWHLATLNRSAFRLSANFVPGESFETMDAKLVAIAQAQPKMHLHNALSGILPARVASAILQRLGIDPTTSMAHLSREIRRKVVGALMDWHLPVRDSRGYTFAEVTAGGVPLDEINPATMESRMCPGLFLVGEILDVDGRIGGFNFQWAWSSGYVCGTGFQPV